MGLPPDSRRPPRSRAGLLALAAVLVLLVWELAGRATGASTVTPVRFARACWVVAMGRGAALDAPSLEEQQKNAFRPLPFVMYGLKPDTVRLPMRGQPEVVRSSNSLGFRGPEPLMPKPAGRFRIVCLGGSTTYGDTVTDEDSYPRVLERLLRKARPDRDIEVINAGIPSYTTAESLTNLAFRCLDLQPDMVVLYEGINDYRTRVYRNFDSAYFHYRKVWDGTVAQWETGEGDTQDGINALIQYNVPPDNGDKAANLRRSGTGAFRRNIVSMHGLATSVGAKVVLVSNVCDESGRFTPPDLAAGIAEHNAVLRAVAAEHGAQFIDLEDAYRQEGQFVDPVHMNRDGSVQMARIIAQGLLAGGL